MKDIVRHNPPTPPNEKERLEALEKYQILDTLPEILFDEITELAAEILQCPVSFIQFMDEERQWFKAKYGLPPETTEVPRDVAICSHTICQSDLLLVPDLDGDERFSNNPLVTSMSLKFYAGMPLITDKGEAVGTLCAIDFEAKEITEAQQQSLRRLSRQVMSQLELRKLLIDSKENALKQERLYSELASEKQSTDELMLNILPQDVAAELKRVGKVEPRYVDDATIMFCDFVGFTKLTQTLSPKNLIELLHQCFCAFDSITNKHGVEKVKTIGDAYMCVSGVTGERARHADRMCHAALEMLAYLEKSNIQRKKLRMPEWNMRIGVHTGPVIAGVVGQQKFAFDIWGDAVNIAALMEQNSAASHVNISGSTKHSLVDKFESTRRGVISTKKRGDIEMFYL